MPKSILVQNYVEGDKNDKIAFYIRSHSDRQSNSINWTSATITSHSRIPEFLIGLRDCKGVLLSKVNCVDTTAIITFESNFKSHTHTQTPISPYAAALRLSRKASRITISTNCHFVTFPYTRVCSLLIIYWKKKYFIAKCQIWFIRRQYTIATQMMFSVRSTFAM